MAGVAALGAASVLSVRTALAAVTGGREVLSLNKGWRFHEGDIAMPKPMTHEDSYMNAKAGKTWGAAAPEYDDARWQAVRLPHDFVVAQPITRDADISQGYRPRGIVWYRNTLVFDEADRGKHIEIQFDGIGTLASIWFNGTLIAHNWSGYNSIYLDVTPFVQYGAKQANSLVVRADADAMQGWWYEGGGIYRNAWVIKRNATHVISDGVFAHPVKSAAGWDIPIEVTLNSIAKTDQTVKVTSELWDGDKRIASADTTATVAPLRRAVVTLKLSHASPRLWSDETPELYRVTTKVTQRDTVLDAVTTTC
ncbi:MAG: beta-galactosidase, partial [Asticcacaulis sp.]|nr:beta-galactosidase [Asticcacaulis sp.]